MAERPSGRPRDPFAGMVPDPGSRRPLPEQVARRLLELIRSGNLRPGDRLPAERDLAAMFAVSVPSVREALRALAILGVLQRERGGAVRVSSLALKELFAPLQLLLPLNADNIDTHYRARVFVDGGIGRMAAQSITPEALARLRHLLELQATLLEDPVGFRVADLEFHQIVLDACANPFLDQIGRALYELGMEYRRIASETPGVIAQSLRDHAAIVEALEARDPERSGLAMEAHVRNVDRSTREAMRRPGTATGR
jgi:DNA-binding FadR family transcriptional regulator